MARFLKGKMIVLRRMRSRGCMKPEKPV